MAAVQVIQDRPKRARGQATRADILSVARRLFSEHGYRSTGLADIQEATGLTKGAFYHHFRSKEELALAVLELAGSDYAEQLTGPALTRQTPGERIEALLDGVVQLNGKPEWCNCQMIAVLCAELTARDDRLREACRAMQVAFLELWRDLIGQAQQAGQVGAGVEPAAAAQWVVSTMTGLALARKLGTAQVPPQKVVAMIKATLLQKSVKDSA